MLRKNKKNKGKKNIGAEDTDKESSTQYKTSKVIKTYSSNNHLEFFTSVAKIDKRLSYSTHRNRYSQIKLMLFKKLFPAMIKTLHKKYSTRPADYDVIVVDNLIYNKNCHLVTVFKDCMILDYIDEFLKRMYRRSESRERIPKFANYYKNYLKFFCNPIFRDFRVNDIIQSYGENQAEIYYKKNYGDKTKVKKSTGNNHIQDDIMKTIFNTTIKDNIDKNSLTQTENTIRNEEVSNLSIYEIEMNKEDEMKQDMNIFNKCSKIGRFKPHLRINSATSINSLCKKNNNENIFKDKERLTSKAQMGKDNSLNFNEPELSRASIENKSGLLTRHSIEESIVNIVSTLNEKGCNNENRVICNSRTIEKGNERVDTYTSGNAKKSQKQNMNQFIKSSGASNNNLNMNNVVLTKNDCHSVSKIAKSPSHNFPSFSSNLQMHKISKPMSNIINQNDEELAFASTNLQKFSGMLPYSGNVNPTVPSTKKSKSITERILNQKEEIGGNYNEFEHKPTLTTGNTNYNITHYNTNHHSNLKTRKAKLGDNNDVIEVNPQANKYTPINFPNSKKSLNKNPSQKEHTDSSDHSVKSPSMSTHFKPTSPNHVKDQKNAKAIGSKTGNIGNLFMNNNPSNAIGHIATHVKNVYSSEFPVHTTTKMSNKNSTTSSNNTPILANQTKTLSKLSYQAISDIQKKKTQIQTNAGTVSYSNIGPTLKSTSTLETFEKMSKNPLLTISNNINENNPNVLNPNINTHTNPNANASNNINSLNDIMKITLSLYMDKNGRNRPVSTLHHAGTQNVISTPSMNIDSINNFNININNHININDNRASLNLNINNPLTASQNALQIAGKFSQTLNSKLLANDDVTRNVHSNLKSLIEKNKSLSRNQNPQVYKMHTTASANVNSNNNCNEEAELATNRQIRSGNGNGKNLNEKIFSSYSGLESQKQFLFTSKNNQENSNSNPYATNIGRKSNIEMNIRQTLDEYQSYKKKKTDELLSPESRSPFKQPELSSRANNLLANPQNKILKSSVVQARSKFQKVKVQSNGDIKKLLKESTGTSSNVAVKIKFNQAYVTPSNAKGKEINIYQTVYNLAKKNTQFHHLLKK